MVRVIGSVKMMIWDSENGHRGAVVRQRVKELAHEPVWLLTNWMAIIVKGPALNMKHVKWLNVTVSWKYSLHNRKLIINFHEIFLLLQRSMMNGAYGVNGPNGPIAMKTEKVVGSASA